MLDVLAVAWQMAVRFGLDEAEQDAAVVAELAAGRVLERGEQSGRSRSSRTRSGHRVRVQ